MADPLAAGDGNDCSEFEWWREVAEGGSIGHGSGRADGLSARMEIRTAPIEGLMTLRQSISGISGCRGEHVMVGTSDDISIIVSSLPKRSSDSKEQGRERCLGDEEGWIISRQDDCSASFGCHCRGDIRLCERTTSTRFELFASQESMNVPRVDSQISTTKG
uniref:Uncharacterized protein n=1 Tax=Oryza rufipogon TaxID=4529 RepID=A0A0E0P4N8_ORYRU